ncbi:intermembrane phospholipid transport protein YdbH family protein [Marinobacterium weihaiense]|uniref:YdbH domain-containing protein n=1 Tax=Marinobacterium weihaiense TaxID=2851016 RepID=A0ABS6M9I6_9GAMM|nr:YdbH domain-containing protein [Marinobacterium weihaiense]MBV0932954.1 YdbH domain-containing protein [Marinobacterium weihaiense]
MRKGLIALLLTPLLVLGLAWLALPWGAEYLLQRWLQEQGFERPVLTLRHPSWQRLQIDHFSVRQNRDGLQMTLSVDHVDIRFQPLELLQGSLQELRVQQARLTLNGTSTAPTDSGSSDLALTPLDPQQLFQYAPSRRLVIASLTVSRQQPDQPTWSVQGNLDLEPELLQSRLHLTRNQSPLGYLDLSLDPALNLSLSLSHRNRYLLRSSHQLQPAEDHWQLQSNLRLNADALQDWQTLLPPAWQPTLARLSGHLLLSNRLYLPAMLPMQPPALLNALKAHASVQGTVEMADGPGVESVRASLSLQADWQQGRFSLRIDDSNQARISGLGRDTASGLKQADLALSHPWSVEGHWQQPDQWRHGPLQLTLASHGLRTPAPAAITLAPVSLTLSAGELLRDTYAVQLQLPQIQLRPDGLAPLQLAMNTHLKLAPATGKVQIQASLSSPDLPLKPRIHGWLTPDFSGRFDLTLPAAALDRLYPALRPWLPAKLAPLQITAGQLGMTGQLQLQQGAWTLNARPDIQDTNLVWDEHTRVHDLSLVPQLTLNQDGALRVQGSAAVEHTDSGVRVFGPELDFDFRRSATGQTRLTLSSFSLSVLDGIIAVPALDFDPQHPAINTRIAVSALELERMLALYPQQGLYGSGVLGGALPIELEGTRLHIRGGQLISQGEGGVIRYQASPEIALMGQQNPGIALALGALTDFRFDLLDLTLDYAPDGTTRVQARLKGQNPQWQQGRPVDLNLSIEENLLDLLRTLRLTDRVTNAIDRRFRR